MSAVPRGDRKEPMTIEQLRDGGFMVTAGGSRPGEYAMPVFACGDIEALLTYTRMRFEPSARERLAAEQGESKA